MKSLEQLPKDEQRVLEDFRSRIRERFPEYSFRMTLFGSRARGDAEPDSDMDVLIELEIPQIPFSEKRRLRRVAGEISLESGFILSLLIVDQRTRQERGDFSIFETIREDGIPV